MANTVKWGDFDSWDDFDATYKTTFETQIYQFF